MATGIKWVHSEHHKRRKFPTFPREFSWEIFC